MFFIWTMERRTGVDSDGNLEEEQVPQTSHRFPCRRVDWNLLDSGKRALNRRKCPRESVNRMLFCKLCFLPYSMAIFLIQSISTKKTKLRGAWMRLSRQGSDNLADAWKGRSWQGEGLPVETLGTAWAGLSIYLFQGWKALEFNRKVGKGWGSCG